MTDPLTGYVRVKVVCVFSNDERILAIDAFDPTKDQHYWVPVGGRVEFGETSREAIEREVREELSSEVESLKLLGTLENIFTYNEAQGHEIVFVYDGELTERSLYEQARVRVVESDREEFTAYWIDPVNPDNGWPVYPDGLTPLLREARPTELHLLPTGESSRMEGLTLRPATGRDREFLFGLHRAAMGPYIEQLYGPWDDAVQWDFFDRWFQPKSVRVITVEGEDVGVLGMQDRDDEVYVTRIEVHPDWQNRGIGAAVMRDVLQQAKEEGRAVSLHVFEINPARKLYQSLGFVAFEQDEGRILMKATPK